jgi:hypothetical protein
VVEEVVVEGTSMGTERVTGVEIMTGMVEINLWIMMKWKWLLRLLLVEKVARVAGETRLDSILFGLCMCI